MPTPSPYDVGPKETEVRDDACFCTGPSPKDGLCDCERKRGAAAVRMLGENEVKQAVAHFLSRQGSAEYDVRDIHISMRGGVRCGCGGGEITVTALPRRGSY